MSTAEAFADGLATEAEMARAAEQAGEAIREAERRADRPTNGRQRYADYLAEAAAHAAMAAAWTAQWCVRDHHARPGPVVTPAANVARYLCADRADPDGTAPHTPSMAEARAARLAEDRIQATLLRDIFGNPFSPSKPLPSAILTWNDRLLPRLAHSIYDDRRLPDGTLDPSRLAILADALLDAGAEDEELLAHLRSPGPHVRGCHAVDLVLGRS